MDVIIERVRSAFITLWEPLQRRELIDFAEEFTDMREVDTINFLAIYLLGATRNNSDSESAWSDAQNLLETIVQGKIRG